MLVLKVISRLLDYPSEALFSHTDELLKATRESKLLSKERKKALVDFIHQLAEGDLYDVQERYDLLFDRGRYLSLLLFEHVHGESRDRGQAMVDLMSEYSKHGFDVASEQLPDYIPLYLEFLSEQDEAYMREWLTDVSHILTILSERLRDRKCNYSLLFDLLLELSGVTVEREKIAELVKKEVRDDTMEAIDEAWEDKEIRFDDPGQSGCESSCGGGYSSETTPETAVTWHKAADGDAVQLP